MITDLTCIQLINQAYYGGGIWNQAAEIDFVKVFVKDYPEARVIVFPGSETFIDWMRDFEADMRDDPDLGSLEWGFQQGMREVFTQIKPAPDKATIITGHSLGAARALIYGGLVNVYYGIKPIVGIVTFGAPRPGGSKLKKILSPTTQRSYRNCDDPVCDVPFYIPFFKPYRHTSPIIQVAAPPLPTDPWGAFADHHSTLYQDALEKIYA